MGWGCPPLAAQGGLEAPRHQLLLRGRRQLEVQGVQNVQSFDATVMQLETDGGMLRVRGEDMHVLALDVENGTMTVEGFIHSLEYAPEGASRRARGWLSRLLR